MPSASGKKCPLVVPVRYSSSLFLIQQPASRHFKPMVTAGILYTGYNVMQSTWYKRIIFLHQVRVALLHQQRHILQRAKVRGCGILHRIAMLSKGLHKPGIEGNYKNDLAPQLIFRGSCSKSLSVLLVLKQAPFCANRITRAITFSCFFLFPGSNW